MSDYEEYFEEDGDYRDPDDNSGDEIDLVDEQLKGLLGGDSSDSDGSSGSSDSDSENESEHDDFYPDGGNDNDERAEDVLLNHPSVESACISSLHFNLPSGKLIKSVGHLLTSESSGTGEERGVNFNALGPVNDNVACVTCGLSSGKCQGHFGYIKLAIPVPDPFHGKKIIGILNCVCMECNRVIADKQLLKTVLRMAAPRRLKCLSEKCAQIRKRKSEKCPHCQLPLPQIRKIKKGKKDKSRGDNFEFVLNIDDREVVQDIKPQKVRMMFQAINDEEKKKVKTILGLEKVNIDNLMMKYLFVLPTIARPNCESRDRQCEDDLTQLYQTILKVNSKLKSLMDGKVPATKKTTEVEKMIEDEYSKLRYNIEALMQNKGNFAKNMAGRPLKSLRQRLKGKHGRMRKNTMGKRTEMAMRTVISAGTDLRTDEVGIPEYLAKKVTVPDRVTELNYDFLNKLFNGVPSTASESRQHKAPKEKQLEKMVNCVIREEHQIDPHNLPKYFAFQIGDKVTIPMDKVEMFNAKDVIKDTVNVICVKDTNFSLVEKLLCDSDILSITRCEGKFYTRNPIKRFKLQIGDICERQLMNGDWIAINRQPSLHKTSILGKKVRIVAGYTIRLHLADTTTLNADFDGDESAGYVAQDMATRAEMAELIGVANNLNSEQNSRPNMTIVQNCLMGSYELTHDNPIVPRHEFMDCLMAANASHTWESLQRRAKLHGLDPYCGRVLVSSVFPEDFTYHRGSVVFRDGICISGVIDKGSRTGILQHMQHFYSKGETVDFMSNLYFLIYRWMEGGLYSVGIADCDLDADVNCEIERILTTADSEVDAVMSQRVFHDQKMQDSFVESKICTKLADIRNECQTLAVKAIPDDNRFNPMLKSGSKGDFINHTQIVVCLGQQTFNGKRMQYELDNNSRTLPYFPPNSTSPASRGFVRSSFIDGLKLDEFIFHMKGGREGLMDTATKTSETGYLQRRLVKTMEDLSVKYDGTIRGSNNTIVSFLYGSTHLDPGRQIIVQGKPSFCDLQGFANMANRKYVAPKIMPDIVIEQMNDVLINPTLKKSLPELKELGMKEEAKVLKSKISTLNSVHKRLHGEYDQLRKEAKKIKNEREKALKEQQQRTLKVHMRDIKGAVKKWKGK